MQCQKCGNVARIDRHGGDIRVISLYQCNKCKFIACDDCVVVGEHEKELHDYLVKNGINLQAKYCPSCGEKLTGAISM